MNERVTAAAPALRCPVCDRECRGESHCVQCSTDLSAYYRVSLAPLTLGAEGDAALAAGSLDAALTAYAAAVTLDASLTSGHAGLARVHAARQNYEAALAAMQCAVATAPERADLRAELEALRQQQATEAARTRLATAARQRRQRWLWLTPPAAAGLAVLAVLAWQHLQSYNAPPTDWAAVIRGRLQSNEATKGLDVRVQWRGDTLALAGSVPSGLHRLLIAELARTDAAVPVDLRSIVVPPAPSPPVATYCVRRGDSWWSIARRHYGNGQRWTEIRKANGADAGRPFRLMPGDTLVLPTLETTPRPAVKGNLP